MLQSAASLRVGDPTERPLRVNIISKDRSRIVFGEETPVTGYKDV